jgi:hypothetical protein
VNACLVRIRAAMKRIKKSLTHFRTATFADISHNGQIEGVETEYTALPCSDDYLHEI